MNNLYQKIISELIRNKNKKRAVSNKKYHKYKIQELGVEAKIRKSIFRKFKTEIKDLGCKETLFLAQKLYSDKIEEFASFGNYILHIKSDCLGIKQLPYLDKNFDYLKSWSSVDSFCIDILQSLLIKHPNEIISLLKKWNKSKNIWKRRASVVVFVRKIGESGKFTDIVLGFCNDLINDNEDLVKKGIGWALKDNMRGNYRKTFAYVKNLRKNKASSMIILYAIRDLKNFKRREILNA